MIKLGGDGDRDGDGDGDYDDDGGDDRDDDDANALMLMMLLMVMLLLLLMTMMLLMIMMLNTVCRMLLLMMMVMTRTVMTMLKKMAMMTMTRTKLTMMVRMMAGATNDYAKLAYSHDLDSRVLDAENIGFTYSQRVLRKKGFDLAGVKLAVDYYRRRGTKLLVIGQRDSLNDLKDPDAGIDVIVADKIDDAMILKKGHEKMCPIVSRDEFRREQEDQRLDADVRHWHKEQGSKLQDRLQFGEADPEARVGQGGAAGEAWLCRVVPLRGRGRSPSDRTESKQAGAIARRERERRRRRVLVEQQREQEMLEENQLEQVLLEKLGRQSVEESAISYRSWRAKTFEEVVVRNRQARQQQYSAQKKADKEEALRRDQDLRDEMIETMREQEELELLRYRAIERGRHAKRREKLREEMEGILDLIMHMAFADMEQEQLTDKEEVDPTLWREWVSLFQENLPVRLVPSLEDCAEEPAPLTSLPEPTGLANLHPPGSTLNAAALRDFVQGLGQWEVPKTVLDEAQPAVVPFDHEVEVKAALEEVQEVAEQIVFVGGQPVEAADASTQQWVELALLRGWGLRLDLCSTSGFWISVYARM
eukprot:s1445_g6.t1